MSGAELFFGEIVDPCPGFATVLAGVDAGERDNDFVVWPERVNVNAVGADVGACFIGGAMQEEAVGCDSPHHAGADGIVDTPASREVETPDDVHFVYCRVRPDSFDATPSLAVQVEEEGLIAGS